MQKKTMGSFMAALRKASGYTQQQIADKLNVSNKTVSKWECDDGCPEISMLPAIAEIYGITVDELLRGEKANDTTEKTTNTQKTEEQIKYLCDKSFGKFNNGSIVALALVLCSWLIAFLPFIISIIKPYFNYAPFVFILFLLIALGMCAASVAVILTAFNNLVSNRSNDIIEKEVFNKKFSKSINLVSITLALVVATVFSLAGPIFFDFLSPVDEIPILILSGIIGLIIRYCLRRKYGILNTDISPEKQKYRKKHTKITAILLSVMFFLTLALPFIDDVVYSLIVREYCFADGVGYQYETEAEAEREYYKFKNHIIGEKKLYEIYDEKYNAKTDEYKLEIRERGYVFDKPDKDNGYRFVKEECESLSETKTLTFKSQEKEIFEQENTFSYSGLFFEELDRNVNFDDETLTISYKRNFSIELSMSDILTVFLLFFFEALIIVIISNIIYKRKSKNL